MTVNSTSSVITFNGNGSTTTFPFVMSVPETSDLQVFLTNNLGESRQLSTSEYSVTLNPLVGTNPTPTGGTLTYNPFTGALPVGSTLTVTRVIPQTQDTSITNQSIIYPPVIEQEFDKLTMLIQQGGFNSSRALKVPLGDPLPQDLPPQNERINQTAFFDQNGDLTAGTPLDGTIMVSAAMQPVVEASTIVEAQTLFGLNKDPRLVTGAYTVIPDDNRRTVSLQGSAFYTVSVGDPTTYPSYFVTLLVNNDNRAKTIVIFGLGPGFIIYPMQQVWLARGPTTWWISRPGRWFTRVPQNFYVDPVLGNDNNDGLATGAGAFATIAKAASVVGTDVDGDFTINLANGTHNVGNGIVLNKRLPGGSAYKIVGNLATPSNCIISFNGAGAGAFTIAITVADGAVADIRGVAFIGGGGNTYCLWSINSSVLTIGNILFAAAGTLGGHVICWASTLNVRGNLTIAGASNGQYFMGALYNGTILFGTIGNATPISITLQGSITFPSGFYVCELNSTMVNVGVVNTYPNAGFAINTPKSAVIYNAIVNCGGAAIPGDLPANVSNGGFFF